MGLKVEIYEESEFEKNYKTIFEYAKKNVPVNFIFSQCCSWDGQNFEIA